MRAGIVLLVLLLFSTELQAGGDYFVDYLYIEAGEGDSSGGHAAIRFSEDVFHFQYFKGLLRAVRENKKNFEYKYRILGNRTIHVSQIAVSEETYHHLQSYFSHKYLVQTRQFEGLDLVLADIALIRNLIETGNHRKSENNFRYPVKGAALFALPNQPRSTFPTNSSRSSLKFLRWVEHQYGPSYITKRIVRIKQELADLKVTGWNTPRLQLSQDRYPILPYSLSEHFVDLLGNLTALEVIQSGASLSSGTRIAPNIPGFDLNSQQVEALRRYRKSLRQDLLKLVVSTRPDWGYPLMVGLARLRVLDESIWTRKLVLLDTFRQDSKLIDPEDIQLYRETFELLYSEARNNFEREKDRWSGMALMNESAYSLLEMMGNRYAEIAHGVVDEKGMRLHGGDLAPPATGGIAVSVLPNISDPRLFDELNRLNDFAAQYSDQLDVQYRYNLITRNCVSEIFQSIEWALASQSEAAENPKATAMESDHPLGGRLGTSFWNAVPFISSEQVQRTFRVTDSHSLLSYRQNRLKEIYSAENLMMAYFRESNTLTSTLYIRNPEDSFFLFFTDDSILPRPVFGAFNTVAGIGQTLAGVFMSPVDGGDVFLAGLKGFLVSLPELTFFNMRKGSYRYQPFALLMDQSEAGF